jgi:hypothetical protein
MTEERLFCFKYFTFPPHPAALKLWAELYTAKGSFAIAGQDHIGGYVVAPNARKIAPNAVSSIQSPDADRSEIHGATFKGNYFSGSGIAMLIEPDGPVSFCVSARGA